MAGKSGAMHGTYQVRSTGVALDALDAFAVDAVVVTFLRVVARCVAADEPFSLEFRQAYFRLYEFTRLLSGLS